MSVRIPALRNQAIIGVGLFGLALWGAWQSGGKIAAGDTTSLIYIALGFAACVVAVTILRNWRSGFYLFLVWLLFEDLVRKFMGNNLALFFGKDVLLGLIYISLFVAIRSHKEKAFRPPFLLILSLFVWLGVLQVFNQNSPHILYGLLGFKVYFYYIPLMWVGYALIRTDEDLRKLLLVNGFFAIVISGLGITQAILGNTFLNPAVLAPELRDLGDLEKATPLTNQMFSLPSSVFVSAGRFNTYLIVVMILVLGTAGYLLLSRQRGSKIVYLALAAVGGGVALLRKPGHGADFLRQHTDPRRCIPLGGALAPPASPQNSQIRTPLRPRERSRPWRRDSSVPQGGRLPDRLLHRDAFAR